MDQRAPISFHKTVDREKIGYLVSKIKCLHFARKYFPFGNQGTNFAIHLANYFGAFIDYKS